MDTASAASPAVVPGIPVTAPLALALWAVLDDAIGWRQPANYGCCDDNDMCGDHQADDDRARAMEALQKQVEQAVTDEAALAVLRDASPELLAAVTGEADPDGGARDDG